MFPLLRVQFLRLVSGPPMTYHSDAESGVRGVSGHHSLPLPTAAHLTKPHMATQCNLLSIYLLIEFSNFDILTGGLVSKYPLLGLASQFQVENELYKMSSILYHDEDFSSSIFMQLTIIVSKLPPPRLQRSPPPGSRENLKRHKNWVKFQIQITFWYQAGERLANKFIFHNNSNE